MAAWRHGIVFKATGARMYRGGVSYSAARGAGMLIRHAELEGGSIVDVRIERGVITAIGHLDAYDNEPTLDANSGLLLPGLHDHHIHVAALAASLNSVRCGPPDVTNRDTFAARLQIPGSDWLRATGYHERRRNARRRHTRPHRSQSPGPHTASIRPHVVLQLRRPRSPAR